MGHLIGLGVEERTRRRDVYGMCMTRRNISLPDELDERARDAGLNVSALARAAILAELDRRSRMASLDSWLDALDEEHGPPSARVMAAARRWADNATGIDVGDAEQRRIERSSQRSA